MKSAVTTTPVKFIVAELFGRPGDKYVSIGNKSYTPGQIIEDIPASEVKHLLDEKLIEQLSDRYFAVKALSCAGRFNNIYQLHEQVNGSFFQDPDDLVRLGFLIEISKPATA